MSIIWSSSQVVGYTEVIWKRACRMAGLRDWHALDGVSHVTAAVPLFDNNKWWNDRRMMKINGKRFGGGRSPRRLLVRDRSCPVEAISRRGE